MAGLITYASVLSSVRTQLIEQTAGRFLEDSEIKDWMQEALNIINRKVMFLKQRATIAGTASIETGEQGQKIFGLPSDFLSIDPEDGISISGIYRKKATAAQYRLLQAKAVGDPNSGGTVSTSDFFSLAYEGVILNFFTKGLWKDEIDAGRSGWTVYFDPDINTTDTVTYWYACQHPDPSTDDIYIQKDFKMLVVWKTCEVGAMKFINAGRASTAMLEAFSALAEREMEDALLYYKNQLTEPPRILSPKDLGLYCSMTRGGNRTRVRRE